MAVYPFDKQYEFWNNDDFKTPINTPVRAIVKFHIDFAGEDRGLGVAGNDDKGRWRYWHLSKILKTGWVNEGEVFALSGGWPPKPGEETSGPHTHIDYYINGIKQDIMKLIGGSMDYKAEYENLLRWKNEVEAWSNGVQASHVDPTLRTLGEDAFLGKPFSEKIKVISDYAKQVPGLKNEINAKFKLAPQLYVKEG